MEKKFYIQPATEQVCTVAYGVMKDPSVGFGGNTESRGGDSPLRQFSGETQGLKYLI